MIFYSFADFSDNNAPVTGEKKVVSVKGFFRKSKLVRGYRRKVKVGKKRKLDNSQKLALGTATLLGVSLATYNVIKYKHIKNLDKIANNLKAEAIPLYTKRNVAVKDVVVTIGGFNPGKVAKQTAKDQSDFMAASLKRLSDKEYRKTAEFISFDHKFDTRGVAKSADSIVAMGRAFFRQVAKGDLPEAKELAEILYGYSKNGKVKRITVVGFSAGSTIAKDITYILQKKGVKVDVSAITMGSPDFGLTPHMNNTLNILAKKDPLRVFGGMSKKTWVSNPKGHHPLYYFNDTEVQAILKRHLTRGDK